MHSNSDGLVPCNVGVSMHDFPCCSFQEVVDIFNFAIHSGTSGAGLDVFEC